MSEEKINKFIDNKISFLCKENNIKKIKKFLHSFNNYNEKRILSDLDLIEFLVLLKYEERIYDMDDLIILINTMPYSHDDTYKINELDERIDYLSYNYSNFIKYMVLFINPLIEANLFKIV